MLRVRDPVGYCSRGALLRWYRLGAGVSDRQYHDAARSGVVTNGVSCLQTELRNREGHETVHVGLEAMPLDEHIEGGHGEGESGVDRRPHTVHDLLEVTDQRQHREHRFHQDAVVPLPALTDGSSPLCFRIFAFKSTG